MYLSDKMCHYKQWNKIFERVTGYSAEEILNLGTLDTISIEDKEKVGILTKEVFLKGHSEAEFSHSICPDCAKKLILNGLMIKEDYKHDNKVFLPFQNHLYFKLIFMAFVKSIEMS